MLKRLAKEMFSSIYTRGSELDMDSMTSVDVMLHLGEPYFDMVGPCMRRVESLEKRLLAFEDSDKYKQLELEKYSKLMDFVLKLRTQSIKMLMFHAWKCYIKCLKGMYRRFRLAKLRIWWNGFKSEILRNIFRTKMHKQLCLLNQLEAAYAKLKEENDSHKREIESLNDLSERHAAMEAMFTKMAKEKEELERGMKILGKKLEDENERVHRLLEERQMLQQTYQAQFINSEHNNAVLRHAADQSTLALKNAHAKVVQLNKQVVHGDISDLEIGRNNDILENEIEFFDDGMRYPVSSINEEISGRGYGRDKNHLNLSVEDDEQFEEDDDTNSSGNSRSATLSVRVYQINPFFRKPSWAKKEFQRKSRW
jgi:hypothetical protein